MRSLLPTRSLVLLPALALAACTVGPEYAGPPKSASQAPAFVRSGDAPVAPQAPVARWWEALGDAQLDALVDKALAANPNAQVAEARLRQARAALGLEKANLAPSANAMAVYAHARLPGVDLSGEGNGDNGTTNLNLYNLGFDASWEIDLFGGQRRTIEAARAQMEAAQANLADTQVSLTAEVAQAYINLRDRQQRLALGRAAIAKQEQGLGLARQRLDRGTMSDLDVTRLDSDLEKSRADLKVLETERDAYLDELATLVGEQPGALDATLGAQAPLPLPPATVAIGDPAALLQRRPDIRAAERTLAADTAKIGAAEAARFPRLSFMGLIGIGGTSLDSLSRLDDFAAIAAPQLSWNFLDFGRNKARVGQAEAVRDEAEAQYRGSILAALRDAEGALARYRDRRATVASLARAKQLADKAAGLSDQRYKAGTATLIDLLDVQRQQITADQNLSVAQAGLTSDFIALQKALGLGWKG